MCQPLAATLVMLQHPPLVSGVRIANQTLTAHLRCVQDGSRIAASTLQVPIKRHIEPSSDSIEVLLLIGQTSSALIAANSRRAARAK
jgi:hypothetical protein